MLVRVTLGGEVKKRLVILVVVLAVVFAGVVAGKVVATGGSSTSDLPASAPPDWLSTIVAGQVRSCGDPAGATAQWVLTDYGSASSRLEGPQPGDTSRPAYLVVVSADEEFVVGNSFSPSNAATTHGKHIELLVTVKTHNVDVFGCGDQKVDLRGLGDVCSYSVN